MHMICEEQNAREFKKKGRQDRRGRRGRQGLHVRSVVWEGADSVKNDYEMPKGRAHYGMSELC